MRVGDNIKYLREKSNMSQVDLANLLGITDKAVSTWENGTRCARCIKKFHIKKTPKSWSFLFICIMVIRSIVYNGCQKVVTAFGQSMEL